MKSFKRFACAALAMTMLVGAEVDIKYSTGFSPHQIMSFAQPLGVGMESEGEYLDIEVNSHNGAKDMMDRLNAVMVPGMHIESIVELPDGVKNAMASISAASYTVTLKSGEQFPAYLLLQKCSQELSLLFPLRYQRTCGIQSFFN